MALWVDKYRPQSLDSLDYHLEQATMLRRLVSSGDFPHLLVYGPSGAGKRTRVMAVLNELYGSGVYRARMELKSIEATANKKISLATISSNYHIEVNAADAGIYDRVVVQNVIKTMAQTRQLETAAQRDFKVVILSEVDRLTKDAQHALRRTMEKYMSTCRLILITNCLSKVLAPVRSRCLTVRVSAPNNEEIVRALQKVAERESLNPHVQLCKRIAEKSKGNLRRAILALEECHGRNPALSDPNQMIQEVDWEVYIQETAMMIANAQAPSQVLEIRTRLYELLGRCIPPHIIFEHLTMALARTLDAFSRSKMVAYAAEYEHRCRIGAKPLMHFEAFIANTMLVAQERNELVNSDDFDDDDFN